MLFRVEAGACPVSFAICFRPMVFFCAAAVRSEGSGVAVLSVGVESGLGRVSSGKVLLHVMSLERKMFSLAGWSSKTDKPAVIRTHPATGCAALAVVQDRCRTAQTAGSGSAQRRHNPIRGATAAPA